MTCNEFKREIEAQFGKVEWQATSHEGKVIQSPGWPKSPSHPANREGK
jgi:hypothetical protein